MANGLRSEQTTGGRYKCNRISECTPSVPTQQQPHYRYPVYTYKMPRTHDRRRRESIKLQRIKVIQLDAEGYSYDQIARHMAMSKSGVGKIIRKLKARRIVKNETRPGRPQKIGPRELRRLNRVVENNPRATLVQITNESMPNCHPRTIEKALHKLDFHLRIPRRKLFLNASAKRKRLLWCRQRRHLTVEDWRKCFYSDEAKVEIGFGGAMRESGKSQERSSKITIFERLSKGIESLLCFGLQ